MKILKAFLTELNSNTNLNLTSVTSLVISSTNLILLQYIFVRNLGTFFPFEIMKEWQK